MKHLVVLGGLAAVMVAIAASQHSPPAQAQDQALVIKAAVAAELPSFEPAASFDGYVIKVSVGDHILVPAASLRDLEASKLRPTWRGLVSPPIGLYVTRHNPIYRHANNTSMRGWGFL